MLASCAVLTAVPRRKRWFAGHCERTGCLGRTRWIPISAPSRRRWYLALADAIKHRVGESTPQDPDRAGSGETLRYLDHAVTDGDGDRIRSEVDATLASDRLRNLGWRIPY